MLVFFKFMTQKEIDQCLKNQKVFKLKYQRENMGDNYMITPLMTDP